jgi:precorrin-6Y C5,15-methyltransferase (decarboxylating)
VTPWLTVIGIGDDGLTGVGADARALIAAAELLVGGERHLAMVPETSAPRLTWAGGVAETAAAIARWRGRAVVVLATGDPMWFGGGTNLARHFPPAEMRVLTHPGAFSLAAAKMVWSLADVETLTVHGRPLATLHRHIQPGARLLILSRDAATPAAVADLLTGRGFGPSPITVLEHLGGPAERVFAGTAERWAHPPGADLNTLAVECRAATDARLLPATPGLPDDVFETDGRMTKREVRAITIAALAPLPGQVLWDVGAGSGSIAIEWLRAVPPRRLPGRGEARAFAIERDPARCARIERNAAALGVPELAVVAGDAPDALATLPVPDTVFAGGGLAREGLLAMLWAALPAGGRLVANAVSLAGIARLIAFHAGYGGSLSRLAVARAEAVGEMAAFRPAMEVTQYVGVKSEGGIAR